MPWSPLRVPPTRDFPTIRRSLLFYKVFAYATGTFLLLVCAEVLLRYVLRQDLPCLLVLKRLPEGSRLDKSALNQILRDHGVDA